VEARLRVIYGDTDQMGVVYYANYLRYFELSRSEYFRAVGGSYRDFEQGGLGLPVVEVSAQYKAPARYEDVITVRIRLAEMKRVTLRFEYEVVRDEDGTLLATGHTVHACVKDGRPTRLPDTVVRLLEA